MDPNKFKTEKRNSIITATLRSSKHKQKTEDYIKKKKCDQKENLRKFTDKNWRRILLSEEQKLVGEEVRIYG